jgi:hypothetical protein
MVLENTWLGIFELDKAVIMDKIRKLHSEKIRNMYSQSYITLHPPNMAKIVVYAMKITFTQIQVWLIQYNYQFFSVTSFSS